MGENSKIQWTDHTWNPWHGCTKVSAGCQNCYMYREKKMYGQDPRKIVRSNTTFTDPLSWKDPLKVFTCSWSDFFIQEADPWRNDAWHIIGLTPHLTYQILTKRPERISDHTPYGLKLNNVWCGISAENQGALEERISDLLQNSYSFKLIFLSLEPLLGPINFEIPVRVAHGKCVPLLSLIGWVIAGGESGPRARPMNPDWARSIQRQCAAAGVPFFFKQWGEYFPVTDPNTEPVCFHCGCTESVACPGGCSWAESPESLLGIMEALRCGNCVNKPSRLVEVFRYGGINQHGGDTWPPAREGSAWMLRKGTKAAGRLLDGRECSEFPK